VLSAQGQTQQRIAEQLGISRIAVNRWVGRFALHRLDGLNNRAGRGRKPWLPQAAVQQVVEQAVTPPPHLGRWSCRTMARAAGISPASVQRLWAAGDIKPHLSRTFKLSNDTRFEEKFWDVIGLYLNPPDKALVLCCDEKSQCQALAFGQHCQIDLGRAKPARAPPWPARCFTTRHQLRPSQPQLGTWSSSGRAGRDRAGLPAAPACSQLRLPRRPCHGARQPGSSAGGRWSHFDGDALRNSFFVSCTPSEGRSARPRRETDGSNPLLSSSESATNPLIEMGNRARSA
jgi:transposase